MPDSNTTTSTNKENYIITLQGDFTPYQRKLIASKILKIADHYNCGFSVSDKTGCELDYDEMMDTKNHPEEKI